jgi:hypothetical protein
VLEQQVRVLLFVSASLAEQPMQALPSPLRLSVLVAPLVSRLVLSMLFLLHELVVLLVSLILWRDLARVRRFRLFLIVLHVL